MRCMAPSTVRSRSWSATCIVRKTASSLTISYARLIANAIIYYNSAILSRLLAKYEASGNAKALALIKKISPAACAIST